MFLLLRRFPDRNNIFKWIIINAPKTMLNDCKIIRTSVFKMNENNINK